MQFVVGHHHFPRVGQHNLCAVEALVRFVDDELVEHARFGILLLHEKVDVGHAVVEHALGNLDRRRLLLHADEQRAQTLLGLRRGKILKVKGNARHQQRYEHQRAHDAEERNAGSLHGQQFEGFAQVAEGDERSQQQAQRQCLRHERDAHIPEKLRQNVDRQALANQFVHITPRKLHHEDEEAYEESPCKNEQELLQQV